MRLMSNVLRTHEDVRGLRATGHVTAPEPSCTRRWVWSHRTRAGTGGLPGGGPSVSVTWRRQSLPTQGAGLGPRGTWRLRSLLMSGDGLGASGHMVIPESFPDG
jgi:hypothetical protein